MNRTTGFATTAGLAALLLAAPALAQPSSGPDGVRSDRSERAERGRAHHEARHERRDRERAERSAAVMNARVGAVDAIRAVEAAGFRAVTEVEWERGVWEIDAQNAAGDRVKLMVDSTTGAMVQQRR